MGTLVMDGVVLEIRQAEQRLEASALSTVQRACELGALLIRAKKNIKHGAWEAWCENTFEGRRSQRWVREMMLVTERCEKNPDLLGMRSLKALSVAASPKVAASAGHTGSKRQRSATLNSETSASKPVESVERLAPEHEEDSDSEYDDTYGDDLYDEPDDAPVDCVRSLNCLGLARVARDAIRLLRAMKGQIIGELLQEIRECLPSTESDEHESTCEMAERIIDDFSELEAREDSAVWCDVVREQISEDGASTEKSDYGGSSATIYRRITKDVAKLKSLGGTHSHELLHEVRISCRRHLVEVKFDAQEGVDLSEPIGKIQAGLWELENMGMGKQGDQDMAELIIRKMERNLDFSVPEFVKKNAPISV